jgi:saccharopine dehydrogenase-like NADP-dependent oxidoreductase
LNLQKGSLFLLFVLAAKVPIIRKLKGTTSNMKTILVLGAGRSSASLIRYLLDNAGTFHWKVIVGDVSQDFAREKLGGSPHGEAICFDALDPASSTAAIGAVDVVISLLPATLHPQVARYCLELRKHLVTASYVSDEMNAFHAEALAKGLLFLNECGLDPGIDHMSAMDIIDRIRQSGGNIISFESFTGGLIAPETDPENPWRYKFTWNPRNVVMAGQGTAKFIENGKFLYIPYQRLFQRKSTFDIPGYGTFEGYANRDSLKYIDTYSLTGIQTLLRGTLRYPGYCEAWDIFVQLGCCDDTYQLEDVDKITHAGFIAGFLPGDTDNIELLNRLQRYLPLISGDGLKMLEWSGFFTDEKVGLTHGTPAQVLEHILNKKWRLRQGDTDLIVMQHRFVYKTGSVRKRLNASLTCKGTEGFTAMAKTVGLPLGIATKLLLTEQIKSRGVVVPVTAEFYTPILKELRETGIEMSEDEGEG